MNPSIHHPNLHLSPEAAKLFAARAKETPPGPRLRVLVVDDDADTAQSFLALAGLWGHECRAATGGPAALEAARDFRPHLVVCDLGMPGMDGYEVARRLRGEPAAAGAMLLAVSGYGRPEDVRRCFEAGFHGHVTKPADLAGLKGFLNRLADALPPGESAP